MTSSSSSDQRYGFFIYGESGVGKSWLAQSVKGRRLVIDTEGGSFEAVDNPVGWDFRTGACPDTPADGTVVVQVYSIDDMMWVLNYITKPGHGFDVIVLDSAHELQNIVMTEMQNPGQPWDMADAMTQPGWGRVLNHMSEFFRQMRDLTRPDRTLEPVHTVVTCAVDVLSEPRLLPLLQEGTVKRLPYWFDLVGFMFEVEGKTEDKQALQIHGKGIAMTKTRPRNVREKFGKQISEPNLNEIILVAQGENQ